jgi:hypothetical protein
MVEVDGTTPLIGERGAVTLLDAFEGRRMPRTIKSSGYGDMCSACIASTAVMVAEARSLE